MLKAIRFVLQPMGYENEPREITATNIIFVTFGVIFVTFGVIFVTHGVLRLPSTKKGPQ